MVFQIKPAPGTVIVELEQADQDVILRADGMGIATLQASNNAFRVSKFGLTQRGIELIIED